MVEPMRIVAILSGMLVKRITRNTHRIANSDGIIVINVARTAKHQQECEKNDATRKYEALGESGKKALRDFRGEDSLARHSAAHRAQCSLRSPGCGPISLHERAHGTDRAEKLGASADSEPHIGELCHIGIGARSGLSQHDCSRSEASFGHAEADVGS